MDSKPVKRVIVPVGYNPPTTVISTSSPVYGEYRPKSSINREAEIRK